MVLLDQKKNSGEEGLLVRNLNKSFLKNEVLSNINLEVHRSEAVGLLGPNGAGKTTCFHILTGLIKPNKGKIFVDGIDITNFPIYIRSKLGIGYLPQEQSVFRGLTVEENLMCILEYSEPDKGKRINILEDLLKDFSLIEKRKENALKLSGGQRRRVEIARTLCTKPSFILLDEPFTGVDPLQLNEIKNLIKNLKKRNIGVLITDHNVREALTVIDRAYIIHEGNVLMHGMPKDIVNNEVVKKVYLGDTFKF
jgi:lipopolysaccharide export system ATP-binding protein